MAPQEPTASTTSSPLSDPSSPKIPVSTSTTYTTSRLPHATHAALVTHLHTTQAIPDLANTLHDSLARTGWTDRIRSLALELLRNGTCTTYPELLEEVLRRAKVPRPEPPPTPAPTANGVGGKRVNGTTASKGVKTTNGVNGHTTGNGSISVREGWFDEDGLPDVRIPLATVEAGVEFLKERIAEVVDVVEGDSDED